MVGDYGIIINFPFSILNLFVESDGRGLAGVQFLALAPCLQHLEGGTVAREHLLHEALADDVVDFATRQVELGGQLAAVFL